MSTDTDQQSEAPVATYVTGVSPGDLSVREAADAYIESKKKDGAPEDQPSEPIGADVPDRIDEVTGKNEGPRIKDAAQALTRHHKQKAEDRAALDEALGAAPSKPAEETPAVEPETDESPDDAFERQALETLLAKAEKLSPAEFETASKALKTLQERRAELTTLGYQVESNKRFQEAHGQLRAAQNELAALAYQQENQIAQAFPETQGIRTPADLQQFAIQNPARATELIAAIGQANQLRAQYAAQVEAHQGAFKHATESWSQAQDDHFEQWFEKNHPDKADAKRRAALTDAVMEMADEFGVTKEQLLALRRGDAQLPFNAWQWQAVMADAASWRMAKKGLAAADRPPAPKVLRPGVVSGRNAGRDHTLQALEAKLNKSGSARDAARLLMARRGS